MENGEDRDMEDGVKAHVGGYCVDTFVGKGDGGLYMLRWVESDVEEGYG